MFSFFKDVSIQDLFAALASDEIRHPPLLIPENSQWNIVKAYFSTTINKVKKSTQNGLGGIEESKMDDALKKITSSIPSNGVTPENLGVLKTLAGIYNDKIKSLIAEEDQQVEAEKFYDFDKDEEEEYDFRKAGEIRLNHEIGREIALAIATKIEERLYGPQAQEDTQPPSQSCILQ
ncbi:MAG: hypothetical protein K2Q33_02735 [Gammaproteobacteria bacterium]|nr:hypothetical protein [Gammaproteobacteria bacterium]